MIKIGERFRCIKDCFMGGQKRYITNKIYKSEYLNCITDETGETHHYWPEENKMNRYFIRLPKNKRKFWK